MTEYLINGLSAVIAVEYISHKFERKYRGIPDVLLLFCGCLGYFLVVTLLNQTCRYEGLMGLSYGAALYLYGLAALRGRKSELAVLSLAWVLIAAISASVMFGVLGILTGEGLGDLLEGTGNGKTYSALAAGVLKFSLGRFVLALTERKRSRTWMEDCMMGGVFLLIFFLVIGMFSLESGGLPQTGRYYLSLGLLCGMFGLVAAVGLFYRLLGRYQIKMQEAEYERESYERQREQIHDLYRIGREANHMRHDMKIKLDVVYGLLKRGEHQEAVECISRLGSEWGDYPELPQETGNEGLNVALLKAVQECRERRVRFHYVVMGRPDHIDSLDMGNLVYNLLKNGMEASEGARRERELEIVIRTDQRGTEIEVMNSIRESVVMRNPGMVSRKKEKMEHGFGMVSIHEIIEKYRGEYDYSEEGSMFIQEIFLRSKAQEQSSE